ncbi:MAG: hypothetical protein RLZZ524_3229 [Pseudomonadota bacterium]
MRTSPDRHRTARRHLLARGLGGLAGLGVGPLALTTLGGAATAAAPEVPLPALGSRPVLPAMPLLDGGTWQPGDAAGQVLVLYWWASWCPFCAVQTPLIEALWRAHRSRGLAVLGLSIDRKPEDALTHRRAKGHAFPSAWVSPDLARQLPKPRGLPVTVVLGRDGRVVMAEAGQLFPEDIEAIATRL